MHARPIEILTAEAVNDGDVSGARFSKDAAVSSGLLIAPHPQFSDTKIAQHGGHASEVIFVPVRYNYGIYTFETTAP